jgi:hypothetical protein
MAWLSLASPEAAWPGAGPDRRPNPPAPGLKGAKVLASNSDVFLVTPRWSPQGDVLVAKGRLGAGIYKLTPAEPDTLVQIADPTTRAAVHFSPGTRTLALRLPTDEWVEHDLSTGEKTRNGRPDYVPRRHVATRGRSKVTRGEVLHDDGLRRIVYRDRFGEVFSLSADDDETLIVQQAWGVALSPDGRCLAYTTGSLSSPILHLNDLSGQDRVIGPGVQPSWFPDSSRFVYSVPRVVGTRADGILDHAASDLYVHDLAAAASRPLAITPEVVEMEPAVSPGGEWIAFSDWRSGTIQVIPTAELEALREGGAP